ncbi:MAG: hypothetical protein RBQ88_01915 [Desulfobulbus oligotrophicus]|nr:hypothetical protein [Desulfobulbus oligotrophicus]
MRAPAPMQTGKIHPAEIGFDFDGVIADTIEAFIRIACEQYDYCGIKREHITEFSVEQCLDMDAGIAEEIFLRILHDSVGTGLLPMPGAVEVLTEMADHTPVTIITARSEAEPVHYWLKQMFPAQIAQALHVVAMGDHDDKARHIKSLGLTAFIDDRVETCLQLRQTGVHSIVFAQPWNHNRQGLPVVHSWTDIRTLCL